MNPFGGAGPFSGFGQGSQQQQASQPTAGASSLFGQAAGAAGANGFGAPAAFSFGTAQGVQWGAQAKDAAPVVNISSNGTNSAGSPGRVSVLKRLGPPAAAPAGEGQQQQQQQQVRLQRQGSQRAGRSVVKNAIVAKRGGIAGRGVSLRRAMQSTAQDDGTQTSPGAKGRLAGRLALKAGAKAAQRAAAAAASDGADAEKQQRVSALQRLIGSAVPGRTSPAKSAKAGGGAGGSPGRSRPQSSGGSRRANEPQFGVLIEGEEAGEEEQELDEATLAHEKAAALGSMPVFGGGDAATSARPASPVFGKAAAATGRPASPVFGKPAGAAAAAQALPFGSTFGAGAAAPAFSFGVTSPKLDAALGAASPATVPVFAFGTTTTAPAQAPPVIAPAAAAPAALGVAALQPQPAPASAPAAAATAAGPAQPFSFGGAAAQQTPPAFASTASPAFIPAANAAAAAQPLGGAGFGASAGPQAQKAQPGFGVSSIAAFGASAGAPLGASTSSAAFSFAATQSAGAGGSSGQQPPALPAAAAAAGAGGDDEGEVLGLDPKCEDMCPAEERSMRAGSRQLHPLERVDPSDAGNAHPEYVVKKYQRSEAGAQADPQKIRTLGALQKTMNYLRGLMDATSADTLTRQRFLWDRYRAVRKDMNQQGLGRKGRQQLAWTIAANEEMVRWHIAIDEEMANEDKANVRPEDLKRGPGKRLDYDPNAPAPDADAGMSDAEAADAPVGLDDRYDGHLNHQELTKTLLDLTGLYDLAAHMGVPTPNISEFIAYYLILMAGQHGGFYKKVSDIVKMLHTCTQDMLASPYVQFALQLMEVLRQGNWRGYLKLLAGAPYLLAAAAQVYLPNMRSTALEALVSSGPPLQGHPTIRHHTLLSHFANELLFDSMQDAAQFAAIHGLKVARLQGAQDAVIYEDRGRQRFKRPKPLPRQRLGFIAQKRGAQPMRGVATQPCPLPTATAAARQLPSPSQQLPTAQQLPPPQQPGPSQLAAGLSPQQPALPPYSPDISPAASPEAPSLLAQQQTLPAMFAPAIPPRSRGQQAFGSPASATTSTAAAAVGEQQASPLSFGFGVQPAAQQQPGSGTQPAPQQQSALGVQPKQQQQQQAMGFSFLPVQQQQWQEQQWQEQQRQEQQRQQQQAAAAAAQAQAQQQQKQERLQREQAAQAALERQRQQQQQQQQERQWRQAGEQQQAHQQRQQQLQQERQQQQQQQQATAREQRKREEQRRMEAELARQRAMEEAAAARRQQEARQAAEAARREEEQRLQDKCTSAGRWLWFNRWLDAARRVKTLRLKRAREEQELASCSLALKLRPQRMHRQQAQQQGQQQGQRRDLAAADYLARQEKRRRLNASWEAQLSDSSPLDLAAAIWPALASSQQPQGSSQHLFWRLSVSSGVGETGRLRVPAFQARVAQWLRAKLCGGHSVQPQQALADAAAAGSAPVLAPLKGSSGSNAAPAGAVPTAAVGSAGSLPADNGVAHENDGRTVWRWPTHDTLTLQQLQLGRQGLALSLQVDDICCSKLESSGGAAASSRGGAASAALQGACGLLLLVPGPDEAEVGAAMQRLRVLLEHAAEGVAVPLAVLACSGPSTVPLLEEALDHELQQLPPPLRAKLSTGAIFTLAPSEHDASSNGLIGSGSTGGPAAGSHADVSAKHGLQRALQFLAQHAPAQLQLQAHPLQALLRGHVETALHRLAASNAAPAVYVQAWNTYVLELGARVAESASSVDALWGWPPPQLSSLGSCRAAAVVERQRALLAGLVLPAWPNGTAGPQQHSGAASLLELQLYLTATSQRGSPAQAASQPSSSSAAWPSSALPEAAAVATALPSTASMQPRPAAAVAAAFQQLFAALLERLGAAGSVLLVGQPEEQYKQWLPPLPQAVGHASQQPLALAGAASALAAPASLDLSGRFATAADGRTHAQDAAAPHATTAMPMAWQHHQPQHPPEQQPQQQQQQQEHQQAGAHFAVPSSKSPASSVREAAAAALRDARELAARFRAQLSQQ